MGDPFLHAWTTQYTNGPMPSFLSTTTRKCTWCVMTEDQFQQDPKPPCSIRDLECPMLPHGPGHDVNDDNGCARLTECQPKYTCVDPSLLIRGSLEESAGPKGSQRTAVSEQPTDTPFAREDSSIEGGGVLSGTKGRSDQCKRRKVQGAYDAPREVNIFEGILAEMLAFDVVRPRSSNGIRGAGRQNDDGINGPNIHDGFSISVGWSSTFFPDEAQ
ncbi:hypothetical protein BDW74DRAFT_95671 [Aspergillus multicolor]|uniref:uncharacterized protein n=1 Tax=Aspergillus multicolor TaxID=41759 RepID=UPI003CCD3802